MVAEDETVASAVSEEERVSAAPPGGAAPFKVAVPITLIPPWTLVGDRDKACRPAGSMTRDVVRLTASLCAVIVTVFSPATPRVTTVIACEVAPAGIVKDFGPGIASASLLDRVTGRPPIGAGELRSTDPFAVPPPTTAVS